MGTCCLFFVYIALTDIRSGTICLTRINKPVLHGGLFFNSFSCCVLLLANFIKFLVVHVDLYNYSFTRAFAKALQLQMLNKQLVYLSTVIRC